MRKGLATAARVLFLYTRFSGMMYYDYNKRSYLLPPGCKDLIDLLRLEEQKKGSTIQLPKLPGLKGGEIFIAGTQEILGPWKLKKNIPKKAQSDSPPAIPSGGQVVIPDEISVLELTKIAGQKPFKVIADLIEIGIFANVKQKIGFEVAARVLKKYGIIAKKAA
jgi:hypothetical protein